MSESGQSIPVGYINRENPEDTFATILLISIGSGTIIGGVLVGFAIVAGETVSGLTAVLFGGLMILFVLAVATVLLTFLVYGIWALRKSRELRSEKPEKSGYRRLLIPLLLIYKKDSDLDRSELLQKRGIILLLLCLTATLIGVNWLLGFPIGEPRPYSS